MRRKRHSKNKLIYIIGILVLVLAVFSTIFALIYSTNSKIISNVKINNIDVAGLNKTEAKEKIQTIVDNILDDEINLKYNDYESTITLKQLELEVNVEDKVYEACTTGRNKNIVANNYKILKTLLFGENIALDYKLNDEIVQSLYNNLDEEWENKFEDSSYYVDGDKLFITKGKTGVVIDKDALTKKINELITSKINGEEINEIEIPVITKEAEQIDLEKIKNEIYKEPKDASYDEETSTLSVETNGVEFGISLEEAKKLLEEDKEEYIIPLKITKPEITTEQFGEEAFPDILGSFSTRYDASNINRTINIELATEAMNGTVLLPGETFSFNGTVGSRTKAKGYMLAGAYSAGELVQSYGGGVCQISSTLYNTALYANLDIVERYNHGMIVSYVDAGRDATVSYGSKDFKFKNSRNYAIKIDAKANNGILEIKILGIKEAEEYEIELISEITDVIVGKTKYKYDKTLAPGQEVVETLGANGAKSIAYKIVKKNGIAISKTVLSEDRYNPITKVIRTGSKQ